MRLSALTLVLLGIILVAERPTHAGPRCGDLMSSSNTDGLITYLTQLLEQRKLSVEAIRKLVMGLERGILENPIPSEQVRIRFEALIHRPGIQQYLDSNIDYPYLLSWARNYLANKQDSIKDRRNTEKDTEKFPNLPNFHRIPMPGYNLEMMEELVTQLAWVEEMGSNPSLNKSGPGSIRLIINKKKRVELKPDHPVSQISWWSAIEYANRLSEQYGLVPAYDLDAIEFREGSSAENGNLMLARASEADKLTINSHSGKIEDAEGFRLPTHAEMTYILSNLGQTSEHGYPFGLSEEEIKEYAWYKDNSHGGSQPVRTTPRHFVIHGNPFYDLVGNIGIWLHDDDGFSDRLFRPGGPTSQVEDLKIDKKASEWPGIPLFYVGVRLVRTLKLSTR